MAAPALHCDRYKSGWATRTRSTTEIYTHYAPDINGERLIAERAFAVEQPEDTTAPSTGSAGPSVDG